MDEQINDFTISLENWKLIESALRATGTLDITTAFSRLNDLYKNESTAGLFAKKTNKMGTTYVAFIEFYLANEGLCLTLQSVINSHKIGYEEMDGAEWAEEFQEKKGNSPTAMRKVGSALKALFKSLSENGYIGAKIEKIKIIKTEWVSPFKTKTSEEGENPDEIEVFKLSLEALSSGQSECLDPVSGDASCEMRVPFLLDVRDALVKGDGTAISLVDGVCKFVDLSRGANRMQKRSASRYFGLCYPLTTMRRQAKDKYLFLIDDVPSKFCYTSNTREALKSDLAEYNVEYMRALATLYASQYQKEGGPLCMESMISNMFNICKIDMSKGGQTQPLLPIFTAMRLILMHEIRCNRPITITITRIGYAKDKYTHVTGYKHCGSKVLFYRPVKGKYVYVPDDDLEEHEKSTGLTNIHTYNMFPLDGSAFNLCGTKPEACFFSNNWDDFLAGFTLCDITHLLRIWAAAHPPVPKASRLWQEESDLSYKNVGDHTTASQKVTVTNKEGEILSEFDLNEYIDLDSYNAMRGGAIRNYIEMCHGLACTDSAEKRKHYTKYPLSLCCPGIPLFDLTSDDMDLYTEYQYYKTLSQEWNLFEAHYAEEFAPEESFYELQKEGNWTLVARSEYETNTQRGSTQRKPSRVTTVKRFERICGALAFSPVHVFLSSYQKESELLGGIGDDWMAGHMTLTFIEEEVAGEGRSYWKVEEYNLDKFDPDIEDD